VCNLNPQLELAELKNLIIKSNLLIQNDTESAMATNDAKGSNGSSEGNGANGANVNFPVTDPAVYQKFQDEWSTAPLPSTEEEWLQRARAVADALAIDAVQRDAENKSPKAEVALLKYAGLLKVLGLKKYGGGGQPWEVGYKVIREVAKADGCVCKISFHKTVLIHSQFGGYATRLPSPLVYHCQRGRHS
jgi:hypothetical protein